MDVLIIEDEPLAQKELQRLLKQTGYGLRVAGIIDSIEDSVEWFKSNPEPDLVFLDIQLSDGISFEIFKHVEIKAAVIFTTAYDEYAIQAFRLNSIDYLLKPIELAALKGALKKLEDMKKNLAASPLLDENVLRDLLNMQKKEYKSRFVAKVGDQIKSIRIEELAYFYAEDNLVFVKCNNGERFIIDHTLEILEKEVDPKEFFRLNRSYLARINAIKKISKYFNSRLLIELAPPAEEKILVSRVKVPEFMEWMGN
jgi:DNA-binding LytR/AlgR family response regulator